MPQREIMDLLWESYGSPKYDALRDAQLLVFNLAVLTRAARKVSSHFLISREPVVWPRCIVGPSQRRHCASMNSHSPVGLVSRQCGTVDWAFVLCDRRVHYDRASRSASSRQCACQFYSCRVGFSGKASHHPGLSAPPPYSQDLAPCVFWLFPKLK